MEPERLVVGRIVKPHGIRGEVSVEVFSDAPDRFAPGSHVYAREGVLTVATARPHQGRMLIRFDGVIDRNAAELLRGAELTIEGAGARALEDGEYYPHDLEGCEVSDESGAQLGRLIRVEETPANDLWVVTDGAREVLVPAVREIILSVDLGARRIVVRPPEGLF